MPLRSLWLAGRETTGILQTGRRTSTSLHTGRDDAMIAIETVTGTMTEEIGTGATGLRLLEDETPRTGIVDHLTEDH